MSTPQKGPCCEISLPAPTSFQAKHLASRFSLEAERIVVTIVEIESEDACPLKGLLLMGHWELGSWAGSKRPCGQSSAQSLIKSHFHSASRTTNQTRWQCLSSVFSGVQQLAVGALGCNLKSPGALGFADTNLGQQWTQ